MKARISRVILFVRDVESVAAFYEKHFGLLTDVHAAKKKFAANGLKFGKVHEVDGFAFANARDPEGNPIQISSRGL